MKLKIEMDLDNDAFREDPMGHAMNTIDKALGRVWLLALATGESSVVNILDGNGNTVGYADLEVDE